MAIGTAAAVLGGGAILGGVASSVIGGKAAKSAAKTQARAADAGIAEQQRQFDEIKELLRPFIETGESALGQQAALAGLGGDAAYNTAIRRIEQGPEFEALVSQGENAILQNASATGGLRGGNTQAALAEFRPEMLAGLINNQYSRLGGLSGLGQASAAGQAAQGQATAGNIAGLLQQRGAAQSGGQLAQGQMYQNILGTLTQGAGMFGKMAGVF